MQRRVGAGVILSFLLFTFTSTVLADGQQLLRGHVPSIIAQLQPLREYPQTNRLHLAISLPLRNQSALSSLLAQIYNPASPSFRHYLTPEQFTAQFGPSERDYQAVMVFAKSNGLEVTRTYPNRVLVDVEGSVGDIERALHTTINLYRHPAENRNFYAPVTEPSLDLSVPVLHISGLDNYALPRPHMVAKRLAKGQNASPNVGSGPGETYIGRDLRAAYVPDSSLNGSGQSVGLLEFDGYFPADIYYYEAVAGLADIPLQNVLVDGASGNPDAYGGGDVEVALDIDMAMSMATNLSRVVVYIGPPDGLAPFEDILNLMVTNTAVKQFSSSWSVFTTNQPAADQIWEQMAAQGQSFFEASGDSDAYGFQPPFFPSDSPYITSVGGTTLTTSGPEGAWVSETVWKEDDSTGSGGGISPEYPIPSWQTNISMTANGGSTTMRNAPDVALTADNVYVRADFGDYRVSGTSCAAPLWAGFAALVNQQATASPNPPIGFINPALDAIGTGLEYTSDVHDITNGNNATSSASTNFYAVPGYDLCTGWGTPAGQGLINALSSPEPLLITPDSGLTSTGGVGGPFTVTSEELSLTNVGTNTLTWTLSNTSSWLNVSQTSGTLTPGGPATTVTVSLNTAANNLPLGTYSATLWFTNLSDGFGHALTNLLNVIAPPAITSQPGNQAVLEGATATFSVTATGGIPLSYQWQFNGRNLTDGGNISGSQTTDLMVSNVSPADVGNYSVTVTNFAGVALSSNASFTITPSAPVIVTQPTNQIAVVGQTVELSVEAVGNMPLSYQWSFAGTNIIGATNSIYLLPDVQLTNAGNFSVQVTNLLGSISSSNAALTVVLIPPCDPLPSGAIGWWPGEDNASDITGTNNGILDNGVTFTNGVVGEAFHFNGSNQDVQIPYAASLEPTNITVECWVNFDSLTSSVAAYPGLQYIFYKEDSFTAAFEASCLQKNRINGQDVFQFQIASGEGADAKATATTVPQPGVWYHLAGTYDGTTIKIYVNGVLEGNTTAGFPINYGTGPIYFGTSGQALAQDDGRLAGALDEVTLYNRALASNEIAAIYNAGGGGKCPPLGPPFIITQPANQTAATGGSATFVVSAGGTPPLDYQWTFSGTNIAGATNSTLTITNVQMVDAGVYSVTVTNIYGSAVSSNAILTVYPRDPTIIEQPTNESVVVGGTATFSVTANGAPPLNYYWSFNSGEIPGATNSTLTLTDVAASQAGSYSVYIVNAYGSTNSAAATLSVYGIPPSIDLVPTNFSVLVGGQATFQGFAGGTQPLSYQWDFNGADILGATNTGLTLTNLQLSQSGSYKITVTNAYGSTSASAALSVVSPGSDQFFDDFSGPSLNPIWQTNLPNGVSAANALQPAAYVGAPNYNFGLLDSNTVMNMHSLIGPWQRTGWSSSTNFPAGNFRYETRFNTGILAPTTSEDGFLEIWIMNATNDNYYYMLSTYDAYSDTDPHLFFGYNLASGFGFEGNFSPITFANNTWYRLALECLPGQYIRVSLCDDNERELFGIFPFTLDTAVFGSEFKIVIAQNVGTETNAPTSVALDYVSLTSQFSPEIMDQPQNQTADGGANATIGVIAEGAPPLSYQWTFNGTNITGATNATLAITNAQSASAGVYNVTVTNAYGSVISSNVLLSISTLAPTILAQPRNESVLAGGTTTFSVTVTGALPLNYFWSFKNSNIPGGTNSTLTLTNVMASQAGIYSVFISNAYGTTNSAQATLTVLASLPRLAIVSSSGTYDISWPTNSAGFVLATTTNLASGNWVPVTNPPVQNGKQYVEPIVPSGTNGFYRLQFTGN